MGLSREQEVDHALGLDKPWKAMDALRGMIFEKLTVQGVSRESLSEPERFVLAIGGLDDQVANGGFHQYFVNPSGDEVQIALAGLEAIGAEPYAALLREALARFPAGQPAADWKSRQEFMMAHWDDMLARLGSLDIQWYELGEQVWVQLVAYCRQVRANFI